MSRLAVAKKTMMDSFSSSAAFRGFHRRPGGRAVRPAARQLLQRHGGRGRGRHTPGL